MLGLGCTKPKSIQKYIGSICWEPTLKEPCDCAHMRRVVAALDEVLKSGENPLDFREPVALDFLPTTLIQELHMVNTSHKLFIHPLFSMLMDEARRMCQNVFHVDFFLAAFRPCVPIVPLLAQRVWCSLFLLLLLPAQGRNQGSF